jgi:hypothetical protein
MTPPQITIAETTALPKLLPGTVLTIIRTGEPSSFSGQNQNRYLLIAFRYSLLAILSAARNFALRERGLFLTSSSDAITGFFVSTR